MTCCAKTGGHALSPRRGCHAAEESMDKTTDNRRRTSENRDDFCREVCCDEPIENERRFQAASDGALRGKGLLDQSTPITVHQLIEPLTLRFLELAFAIARQEIAELFLLRAFHLVVAKCQQL